MTDLTSSSLTPESQFDTTSNIDVSAIDQNVRSIRAVEERWRLPPVPDEVKLDLATMPGATGSSLTDLLLGIDQDLNPEPEPIESPQFEPFLPDRSAMDQFRIISNSVAGNPVPPQELDRDAVQKFKVRAIQAGLIDPPADGQIDSLWSPELNRIRNEMLYDDIDRFYAGDRSGAVPTNKILETIADWTQPSGLLAAATDLDLFWDFGAINREFSTWGDKWRKVSESDNPLDFGKNLIDAVTGPVDDLVFPVLNVLALSTGVGALANAGRIGFAGAKAAQGGRLMRTLYSSSKVLTPSSLKAMAEPSWMAGRLAGRSGVLGGAGNMMTAWRQLPGITRAKQGVQIGMRAGFTSQAQDLFPGYQGGVSARDVAPGVDAGADSLRNFGLYSPLAILPELMFAPQNIFTRGTFVGEGGLLSSAGQGFLAAGGSIPGRAAIGAVGGTAVGTLLGDDTGDTLEGALYGSVGAALLPHAAQAVSAGVRTLPDVGAFSTIAKPLKWIGHATDVVQRLNYRPIADDQQIGVAFQKGIREALKADEEALKRWDDSVRSTNSFRQSLADLLGTDVTGADTNVTFITVASQIDHVAFVQAGNRRSDSYRLLRNKLSAQVRTFDLDSEFLAEEVAIATAIDRSGGTDFERQFKRAFDEIVRNPESARDLAIKHNAVASKTLQQLIDNASKGDGLGALEAYLPNVMDTFGNWPQFSKQSLTIEGWVNAGALDGAEFAGVLTPFGTVRQPKAELFKVKDTILRADEEMTDTLIRDPKVRQKAGTNAAPLARLQPSGRFTMAREGTITKQQLERQAYEIKDLIDAAEKLRYMTETGTLRRVAETAEASGTSLRAMSKDELKSFIRANGFGKNDSQIRYLHSFMNRHGVDDIELRAIIDEQVNSLVNDTELWSGLGLDTVIRDADNNPLAGIAALKHQRKEVLKRARFTAAEIDDGWDATAGQLTGGSIVRSIRETQGDAAADDMLAQLAALRADGYKLVHGVEYMMPHDLAVSSPLFRDHGVRELNAATMGNFFSRRQPAVARANQERRERAALVRALSDHNLGDFDPDSTEITQAYRDLRTILLDIQEPVQTRGEERHLMNFWEKFRHAQESAFTPLRVDDLTRYQGTVKDRLRGMGWTEEQTDAIFAAIRKFRNTDFEELGLYSLEAKVRSKNLNVSALKWLGKSNFGDGIMSPTRLSAVTGAYAGNQYVGGSLSEDANADERLGAKVAGLVGGAVIGGALGKGASKLINRGSWIDDAARRAEQRPAWMLGDQYARFRDAMRFSLSPIFDISRYTEGLTLGRTGTPLRHADGSRVSLPSNLSPWATKRRVGEDAFKSFRNEFKNAAKTGGLGDVDVLDDAGHWFAQIGIMGFNPVEWQVSAYAELRRLDFDPKDAYEAARATHTYGLKGRSPAELSTNFVFFPFSFQKKVLTHMTEFMNDDLGRSILLHDALRAYEVLDEKYNLEEWMEAHVPALEQMQRLNVMAYGASPGRFGGINSQLFETTGKATLQLFSPVGVNLKGEDDYLELQRLAKSLVPAWNDINWMIEEAQETGYMAQNGAMPRADITAGYSEWNDFRKEFDAQLVDQGFSWFDLHNKPYLAQQKQVYEAKLAELQSKYPAWTESRQESIFNIQALEMERTDLLRAARSNPDIATPEAFMLAEMEATIAEVKQNLGYMGVSVDGRDGWLDAPPWAVNPVKEQAIALAERNPRFIGIWKKFYERELGPIEATL